MVFDELPDECQNVSSMRWSGVTIHVLASSCTYAHTRTCRITHDDRHCRCRHRNQIGCLIRSVVELCGNDEPWMESDRSVESRQSSGSTPSRSMSQPRVDPYDSDILDMSESQLAQELAAAKELLEELESQPWRSVEL